MPRTRDRSIGSFRDHIDELLTRLSHEGMVDAATLKDGQSSSVGARDPECQAFMLNEELFRRSQRRR